MKKILTILLILMLFSTLVLAQDTSTTQDSTSAGTTPDSPLWGLDVAFDKISLAFTFGSEKKAEKALQIANERLAELQKMVEENKTAKSEKAQAEHDAFLEKAQENMQKLSEKDPKKQYEAELKFEEKLREHRAQVDDFLANMENRFNGTEDGRFQGMIQNLSEKVQQHEAALEQKREATKERLGAKANDSDVTNLENNMWQVKAKNEMVQAQREIEKADKMIAEFENKKDEKFTQAAADDKQVLEQKKERFEAQLKVKEDQKQLDIDLDAAALRAAKRELGENATDREIKELAADLKTQMKDEVNLVTARITGSGTDSPGSEENSSEGSGQTNSSEMEESTDEGSAEAPETGDSNETDTEENSSDIDLDDVNNAPEMNESDSNEPSEGPDEGTETTSGENETDEEIESELDDIESDFNDSPPAQEYDDSLLAEFGLKLPDFSSLQGVDAAKDLVVKAKEALGTARDHYGSDEFRASYAYAKFAKRLAGMAHTGRYLTLTEADRDFYKQLRSERLNSTESDD